MWQQFTSWLLGLAKSEDSCDARRKKPAPEEDSSKIIAVHFSPPAVRGIIQKHGLMSDQQLFGEKLGLWNAPRPWFSEQCDVETDLELAELRPVHLLAIPGNDGFLISSLAAERGTDMRLIDVAPIIRTGRVVLTHGWGRQFKGRTAKERCLSGEHLLESLAMLSSEAQRSGYVDSRAIVDIMVLTEHPEQIPVEELIPIRLEFRNVKDPWET